MFVRPAFILTVLLAVVPLFAQPIYNPTPDWISVDTPYSTGAALVDMDRDGWLDFVVGNGNDIRRERLAVYYNNGDGTYPLVPNWEASDHEYNGHVSIADVDGDGWLDVAVGLTMEDPGTATARLYLNNEGTLSSLPDWQTLGQEAAFHVAFGDVNGDGRPDLAVGTGFAYHGTNRWYNYVYMNTGSGLETNPSWVSNDRRDYADIFFCDANRDGWLDLAGIGNGTDSCWIYVNNGGTLDTTATWRTTNSPNADALYGTYGDLDDDGWFELIVSDNDQLLGGTGYFFRHNGQPGGFFTATPTWSFFEGYCSAVSLADIDADGDLDLATGGWWANTRYFLNNGGLIPATPTWTSAGTSVVEAIVFGDVDKDGLRHRVDTFDVLPDAAQHLFYLAKCPVDRIDYVLADGVPLGPAEYTYDAVHGWVSVGPKAVDSVAVRYAYSHRPEMAITNWDDNRGNYLYYNLNNSRRFGDFDGNDVVDLNDYAAYLQCVTGPLGPLGQGSDCLEAFDSDGDGDIDFADFSEVQMALGGEM